MRVFHGKTITSTVVGGSHSAKFVLGLLYLSSLIETGDGWTSQVFHLFSDESFILTLNSLFVLSFCTSFLIIVDSSLLYISWNSYFQFYVKIKRFALLYMTTLTVCVILVRME